LRYVAEDVVEHEIDWRRAVGLVVEDDTAVSGDTTNEGHGDTLSFAQAPEGGLVTRPQQEGVVLLILGAPDLEHR
jgi:hypothetical protein